MPMKATKFRTVPKIPMAGIAEKLRLLEAGHTIIFENGSATSVRSILTRIRQEFDSERIFTSKKMKHGVQVWRLA